jgi:hypothetical protein
MPSTINANNTTGLVSTADTSGVLQLQTNGTTAVTVDDSQRVGVGVTPSAWDTLKQLDVGSGGGIWGTAAQVGIGSNVYYGTSNFRYKATNVASALQVDGNVFKFLTAASGTAGNAISFTQAMTLDASGNLLVGTTGNATTGGLMAIPNSNNSLLRIGHVTGSGNTSYYHQFYYDGTLIGSIWQSGTTAVAYNTTSDYRLKTNITPLSGALEKVMALKPSQFDWIDGRPDDGFIAHELQAVLPNVVGGEKDAVNAEGNHAYQQVDYARIVTTLTAAIQEQQALITQLQADVAALKGASV